MTVWSSCAVEPCANPICPPLDRPPAAAYRSDMASPELNQKLDDLTVRLDELGAVLARLLEENRSLRTSQEQLIGERAALLTKNEQARARVEAMILRLKSLEQNA